jgi:hypothetical protein
MMIIIINLIIMFSVVGGDGGGRGGITAFLSGSNFCRHTAYPDLLCVMFVSPSRKMAERSIKLGQDGFLSRYLHIIIDYYPDIWPHTRTLVIASLDKLQINHSSIHGIRSSERCKLLIIERYAKVLSAC